MGTKEQRPHCWFRSLFYLTTCKQAGPQDLQTPHLLLPDFNSLSSALRIFAHTLSALSGFMFFNSLESLTQAPFLPNLPDSHSKPLSCSLPILKANLVLRLYLGHLLQSVLLLSPSLPVRP